MIGAVFVVSIIPAMALKKSQANSVCVCEPLQQLTKWSVILRRKQHQQLVARKSHEPGIWSVDAAVTVVDQSTLGGARDEALPLQPVGVASPPHAQPQPQQLRVTETGTSTPLPPGNPLSGSVQPRDAVAAAAAAAAKADVGSNSADESQPSPVAVAEAIRMRRPEPYTTPPGMEDVRDIVMLWAPEHVIAWARECLSSPVIA